MRATAAERYASGVRAARSLDADFLTAAAIAASRGGDDALALSALRLLAGDQAGVGEIIDDLGSVLMRASFRKRIAHVSRPAANAIAATVLAAWAGAGSAETVLELARAEGAERHVHLLLARLDRLVDGFSRDVSRLMGAATA